MVCSIRSGTRRRAGAAGAARSGLSWCRARSSSAEPLGTKPSARRSRRRL